MATWGIVTEKKIPLDKRKPRVYTSTRRLTPMTNFDRAIRLSELSIKQIAERTGVSRQAIYHARKRGPSHRLALRAAPVLGVFWTELIDIGEVPATVGAALEAEPVREREEGATEPHGGGTTNLEEGESR